ncbi:MAG TPA: retropepsin-like aspartic protease [Candidatus Berkiella sp.]|nr:retropepsin-like aspartic protease [Candidatus Berkiella sp.]
MSKAITKVLHVWETAGEIKIISADSEKCVLEINGQPKTYLMSTQISTNFAKTPKPIVRIVQDNTGLYRSSGIINEQMVNVIVDTGVTLVTMNTEQAKSLGLDKKVVTASGKTQGYLVNLDQVSLGRIQAYNVQAVITERTCKFYNLHIDTQLKFVCELTCFLNNDKFQSLFF